MATDSKIAEFEFDAAVELAAQEKLANIGVRDQDDLGPGRADVGEIARILNEPDPFLDTKDMEEVKRREDWEKQMQSPEQPYQPVLQRTAPQQQPLEQTATETAASAAPDALAQAQAELDRMKKQYAQESERWGQERKRHAEQKARQEQGLGGVAPQTPYIPSPQTGYYDPRMIGDVDPNVPLTAGQTAALMQQMAAAFGQQMNAREQNVIDAARELRNYDLTSNEEADLIERHGWLTTLDRASQIKAMRDLVQPLRSASQPAAATAPIQPRPVNMVDLARAKHLTATTFIEPSSRISTQEQAAATGADSSLARKIAEYNKAKNDKPGDAGSEFDIYGANKKVERLLREINVLQRRRA